MRLLIGLTLALVLGWSQAAEADAPFLGPDARVFTIAGGGTEKARDGLPAGLIRMEAWRVAVLPEGQVAVASSGDPLNNRDGVPFLIGLDGRVRLLPPIVDAGKRREASLVAGQADGSLLALRGDERVIYRLPPGAVAWERWFLLSEIEGWSRNESGAYEVVGLPAGVAITTFHGIVRVETGQSRRITQAEPGALGAFPDGSLVFSDAFHANRVAIAPPLGPVRPLRLVGVRRDGFPARAALAGLPDGTFVRADWFIEQFGADGRPIAEAGRRPGLGLGDGGPPATALLNADLMASAPGGELVFSESVAFGGERSALDQTAELRPGGALIVDSGADTAVRVIVPGASPRALAAITPATFTTIQSGSLGYATTFSGTAHVTIRRGTQTVSETTAPVAAGEGSLALPGPLPSGNLRLTLTVTGADGRVAVARLAVANQTRLTRRRALRLLRSFASNRVGPPSEAAGCRRTSPRSFHCSAVDSITYPRPRKQRRLCYARITAVLRPDGVRACESGGPRACRALARRGTR